MSSSIPSWQILTAHAQPFRGARDLAFCLKVPLDSLLVWASNEGSGETARMRRLAWTFAARIGDKYQLRLTRSITKCIYISWTYRYAILHWEKVITIHLTFWRLVQNIKFGNQKYLVLYIRKTLAQTLRIILFQKDAYALQRRSPSKGTLVSKSHIFATIFQIYVIDENEFCLKMLPNTMIWDAKVSKVLMQSDTLLVLRNDAKTGTVRS